MTNKEKLIEVMNQTFNTSYTENDRIQDYCPPHFIYKECYRWSCEGCTNWWDKEYEPPKEFDK